MRQQQQDVTMNRVTTISATAVFGMHGVGKSTAIGSSQRRVKRLPHRPRFFDSLDDG